MTQNDQNWDAMEFPPKFDLSGRALCLDFANTVSERKVPGRRGDLLDEYRDLLTFATQSLIIPVEKALELLAISRSEPRATVRTMEDARELREAIYRTFAAHVENRPCSTEDLTLIRNVVVESWKHKRLISIGGRFAWQTKREESTRLETVLWPMAWSASELLTSERLERVRMCEGKDCAWLFLDRSRNRARRWCNMTMCGNREKSRRRYQRENM